ncbi:hypothetical protein RAX56_003937 [Vibrio fluvialis]|nr:hypothetical protein [Vibrio fluvialis]
MKVYKYTPHINLFLRSPSLKLTPFYQLNDPFEAKLTSEYISGCEKLIMDTLRNEKYVRNLGKNLENHSEYYGVISLSESKCDIKMLSHYAENHSGGILEFTLEDIDDGFENKLSFFNGINKNYKFGHVKYVGKRNKEVSVSYDYIHTGVFFDKFICWEEEREVRYLSDFREVDCLLISKDDIVDAHFRKCKKSSENYFSDKELDSFYVDGEMYIFAYKDINSDDDVKYSFDKPKRIRDIIDDIFSRHIKNYEEIGGMIKIVLENKTPDYGLYNLSFSWDRLIESGCNFHPMLKVDPSALTGVYLGVRFDMESLDLDTLNKFENLNGNVKKASISPNDFSHELVDAIKA